MLRSVALKGTRKSQSCYVEDVVNMAYYFPFPSVVVYCIVVVVVVVLVLVLKGKMRVSFPLYLIADLRHRAGLL